MNEDVHVKKFHWMDVCIKCDTGGKLLACLENGCPVVVHEDCLGCEAQFDEMGNFYCPYCVCKRATQEFTRAERKAVLAEKALSKYLDGNGVGSEGFVAVNVTGSSDVLDECVELEKDCHEVTGPECIMTEKDKESDVLLKRVDDSVGLNDDIIGVAVEKQNELECVVRRLGDECCGGEGNVDQQKDVDMNERHQSGDNIQNDAIQNETLLKHHQDAGRFEACKIMKENVEAAEENERRMDEDEVQNQEQTHKTSEKIVCKESAPQVHTTMSEKLTNRKVDDTTAFTCMDTNTISEKGIGAQSPCVNTPRRSSRKKKSVQIENSSTPWTPRRSSREKKSVQVEKISTPCKSSKVAKPPTIFTTLPTLKEKRKRLAWKVEEEEILKKGVQKYSETVNKNLPWQKILEEGHGVFDETRTPADLKDKWRNILSKEPLFDLS